MFPPVPAPKSNIKDFVVTVNYEVMLKVLKIFPLCPALGPQGSAVGFLVFRIIRQGLLTQESAAFCRFSHLSLSDCFIIHWKGPTQF